jgi:hypothetical protein
MGEEAEGARLGGGDDGERVGVRNGHDDRCVRAVDGVCRTSGILVKRDVLLYPAIDYIKKR